MRLSPNFLLAEMIASETAARRRIDNSPSAQVIENLKITAAGLEQVRALLGNRVITVSSGYRSKTLNIAVGGSVTSDHVEGYAADFNAFSYGTPLQICRAIAASDIKFDQLIEEGTWVHISFDPKLRRQIMTKAPGKGYTQGLRK